MEDWQIIEWLGVVFAYNLRACRIKAFPEAIDKKGNTQLNHPSVAKYFKDMGYAV